VVRADIKNAEQQLVTIVNLSLPDLLEQWHALGFGEPPRLPLPLMQRLLAQLLQEQVDGGLSAKAVRQLDAAAGAAANDTAKGASAGSSASRLVSQDAADPSGEAPARPALPLLPKRIARPSPSRQVTLRAGTRLVREWNGRTISVEVVDDHFVWNDAPYRSLSEIARAVTGTRWSGPRFFGIAGRG
jgi:hypothetical protein